MALVDKLREHLPKESKRRRVPSYGGDVADPDCQHLDCKTTHLWCWLYILTATDDGGVPIYFTTADGNTTDDRTHVETWNLLRQLVGHADFLYVADCKLATKTNMQHIDKRKGRFVTILPRTRKENQEFHERVRRDPTVIPWRMIDQTKDRSGEIIDTISVLDEEQWSAEKFRVLWFHRTRKAATDSHARLERIERANKDLEELRDKLGSPKTRYRERAKVATAVAGKRSRINREQTANER